MKKLLVLLFGLTLGLTLPAVRAEDAPLPFDDPSSPAPAVRAQAEVGASHSRPARNSVRHAGKGKHAAAKPAKRTKATATAAKGKPAAGKSKPATKSATKAKGSKKPAAAKTTKKK